MPFKPVILWTDALIYLLLAVTVAYGVYAARHEHLRWPWRQVRRNPLAMAALVVLVAYVVVGLADSIHFRMRLDGSQTGVHGTIYSPQVLSALDLLCTPLRTHVEQTYSAPFALHAFTPQLVRRPDGSHVLEYPRLRFAGAGLETPADRARDIAVRSLQAAVESLMLWAAVVGAIAYWQVRQPGESARAVFARMRRGQTDTPWRAMLASLGVVILIIAAVANLGAEYHILGTDQVGQDVLFEAIKSIRTGLLIGTLTTLVMLPFALVMGVMAGYFGGRVDDVIQYIYTTLSSIPSVLLIVAGILSLDLYMANHATSFDNIAQRQDVRLLSLCIILGVTTWTGLCRLLRGETMKLRDMDYIQAAIALGVRSRRIMTRHIIPNVMHIVLINVVLNFSGLVLAEAVLSYIGVGVDPSMNSWGNMINGARMEMARDPVVWWALAAAFLFMFTLVLAANLFADAVRDAFDPRMRK